MSVNNQDIIIKQIVNHNNKINGNSHNKVVIRRQLV